ncbi:unnamed protein product, partial [Prorocentrum cordatum]
PLRLNLATSSEGGQAEEPSARPEAPAPGLAPAPGPSARQRAWRGAAARRVVPMSAAAPGPATPRTPDAPRLVAATSCGSSEESPPSLPGTSKRAFRGEHLKIPGADETPTTESVGDSAHARITSMRTPVSAHLGSVRRSLELDAATSTPGSASKPVVRRWNSGLAWGEDGLSRHCYVSLSEPGLLPWLCCLTPGFCLFGTLLVILAAAAFSQVAFYYLTALLTGYVACWSANLAVSCTVGFLNMRRDSSKDWHAMLREVQAKTSNASVMHIVILPNYKEDEEMMFDTLLNIAKSPLAKDCIRIALGMEEREGPSGQQKAERLIARCKGMFSDMFATFHPPGRQGETAGKSSNTQWAYRGTLERYADELTTWDPSRVFLTVGDADTIWNPQYFDCLAYRGLTMPKEEVAWTIWQPPLLLFRNLFAVPAFTRLSGFGTFLFELAGLANQRVGVHFCFSSYSLTLALASHRVIQGWDPDVIAEDHHMFCKCFFGAMWEAAKSEGDKDKDPELIEPKVRLCPVWLPAEGYLVESSEGYWESCVARFQQARRHAQGVAELGYATLQYVRLLAAVGPRRLSARAHLQIWSILLKMSTVHIFNTLQAFVMTLNIAMAVPAVVGRVLVHGLAVFASPWLLFGFDSASSTALSQKLCLAAHGPLPLVGVLSAVTLFLAVKDVIEGRYIPKTPHRGSGGGKEPPPPAAGGGRMSTLECVTLAAKMQHDMLALSEPTILLYGMVPEILAAWSLLRKGSDFEYIVAAKPTSD